MLADRIAQTALNHYDNVLANKGKPKANLYAAIVASRIEVSWFQWVVVVIKARSLGCPLCEGDKVLRRLRRRRWQQERVEHPPRFARRSLGASRTATSLVDRNNRCNESIIN